MPKEPRPPAAPDPGADATTGRSWPDALVHLAQLLGRLGPWVIIVGGILFAFYMFQQQAAEQQARVEDVRTKATEQSQQMINEANDQLRKTFDQIAKFNADQLGNLNAVVDVQKKVFETTLAQQDRLRQLQEQSTAMRLAAEDAKRQQDAAETAHKDAQAKAAAAEAARKELEGLHARSAQELAAVRSQVDQRRQELAKLDDDLRRMQSDLERQKRLSSQQVADIGDIRIELEGLINKILADERLRGSEAHDDATKLRATRVRPPREILQTFATAPESESTQAGLRNLVGQSEAELEAAIGTDGAGFAGWYRLRASEAPRDGKEASPETLYLAVTRFHPHGGTGVVGFTARDGKIAEVEHVAELLAAVVNSPRDWMAQAIFLGPPESGETWPVAPNAPPLRDLRDVLAATIGREWPKPQVDLLAGTPPPFAPMTAAGFAAQYERAFGRKPELGAIDEALAISVQMADRAATFQPAKDVAGLADIADAALRGAFTALAAASVTRNEAGARPLLAADADPGLLGRFAALLLQKQFRIVAVTDALAEAAATRAMTQLAQVQLPIQGQPPPAVAAVPAKVMQVTFVPWGAERPEPATLRFRANAAGDGWLLYAIEGARPASAR